MADKQVWAEMVGGPACGRKITIPHWATEWRFVVPAPARVPGGAPALPRPRHARYVWSGRTRCAETPDLDHRVDIRILEFDGYGE